MPIIIIRQNDVDLRFVVGNDFQLFSLFHSSRSHTNTQFRWCYWWRSRPLNCVCVKYYKFTDGFDNFREAGHQICPFDLMLTGASEKDRKENDDTLVSIQTNCMRACVWYLFFLRNKIKRKQQHAILRHKTQDVNSSNVL